MDGQVTERSLQNRSAVLARARAPIERRVLEICQHFTQPDSQIFGTGCGRQGVDHSIFDSFGEPPAALASALTTTCTMCEELGHTRSFPVVLRLKTPVTCRSSIVIQDHVPLMSWL